MAQKKLPTGISFIDLFAPKNNYPYFDHAASYPFDDKATRFQLINAWWMAEFSLLAYLGATDIEKYLNEAKLELVKFFDKNGTQCFIAQTEHYIVTAFRGTQISEKEDIIADIKAWQVEAASGSGEVHAGFKHALDEVWDEIKATLDSLSKESPNKTLWFTGHSLGAALATLAANRYPGQQGLYTFGSPRVGNLEYANDFQEMAYRIVNQNDIVTTIPPMGLFKHVGDFKYINSDDEIWDSPRLWRKQRDSLRGIAEHSADVFSAWRRGDFDAVLSDRITDHSPLHYAIKIWNAYDKEK